MNMDGKGRKSFLNQGQGRKGTATRASWNKKKSAEGVSKSKAKRDSDEGSVSKRSKMVVPEDKEKSLEKTKGNNVEVKKEEKQERKEISAAIATTAGKGALVAVLPKEAPVTVAGKDGLPALDVFPKKVWELILDSLTDPKDLWNCSNTCQLFQDTLRQWKTGWMMEQALPHLYKHLPGRKLLQCRLVSKGWNTAVDGFLVNNASLRPPDEIGRHDPRYLQFVNPMKEKNLGNKFVFSKDCALTKSKLPQQMPGRNPIIGRYITLNLASGFSSQTTSGKWEELYKFLERYGKEIWYVFLVYPDKPNDTWRNQKVLEFCTIKLLQLLPNLRRLCMTGPMEYDADVVIDPESIPTAPNLESLWGIDWGWGGQKDIVFEALLQRHHVQLRKIFLSQKVWERVSSLEWPNLVELHVNFSSGYFHGAMEDLRILSGAGVRMPQLSKLSLTLPHGRFSYEHLLEVMNELNATTRLTTLRLVGAISKIKPPPKETPPLKTHPTKPSTLKNLEVNLEVERSTVAAGFNFDFLLKCFPLLENYNFFLEERTASALKNFFPEVALVSRRVAVRTGKDKIVELEKYGWDGKMYSSKVWEVLPRLKAFTFQWDVYTREGYEACTGNGKASKKI